MSNYKTATETLHAWYEGQATGKVHFSYAAMLYYFARTVLEKSRIFLYLDEAKELEHLYSTMLARGDLSWIKLGQLLYQCYEPIPDDLLLMCAYELYLNAYMLRKGYVVHEIKMPPQLCKAQKKRPIHVRTIRSRKYRAAITLGPKSLQINVLLRPEYLAHFATLSPDARDGLNAVHKRRNEIAHLNLGLAFKTDKKLLAFVEHLRDVIPLTNRRGSAANRYRKRRG